MATPASGTGEFQQGVAESDPNAIANGFVVTGEGSVLSGVEPPARPAQVIPAQQFTTVTSSTTPAVTTTDPNTKFFTAEDVENARKQEKDKLYTELQEMKKTLKEREAAERERAKQEEDARKAAEEAANKKAEEDMELRDLLAKRDLEWKQQLEAERQERERLAATLDAERNYASLVTTRAQLIEANRDEIIPELIDLVSGNSEDELQQSILSLKQRSASIMENVAAATTAARQAMRGTPVSAPPGPMETQQSQQTLSAEDIRQMTPSEYAQHRDRLLGGMRNQVQQGGIYG